LVVGVKPARQAIQPSWLVITNHQLPAKATRAAASAQGVKSTTARPMPRFLIRRPATGVDLIVESPSTRTPEPRQQRSSVIGVRSLSTQAKWRSAGARHLRTLMTLNVRYQF
jgi:hypothetical protein